MKKGFSAKSREFPKGNNRKSLDDLIKDGYSYIPVRERLTHIVQQKKLKDEEFFADIFGLELEKRRILEVLMSGKGVLLTGDYGTAKTEISKRVAGLLNAYLQLHEVYTLEACPVQEDAMNLAFTLGFVKDEDRNLVHACPICQYLYLNSDPEDIPVIKYDIIKEGKGFARLQGGYDVLPEEIIGTYNLIKLSEIGDPFDPRVFQPGKLGQASGGVLFVDELGKLSDSGQAALIQASQEGIFTPSKTRETFPIDFLLIATTNPVNEEDICGAVLDRLVSIKIPMVEKGDEIKVVKKELDRVGEEPYILKAFLDFIVTAVRRVRKELPLGPRVSINAGLIARASATFDGRKIANYCDYKEGIYTAILGKAKFEDKDDYEAKVRSSIISVSDHLKNYFQGINLEAGIEELKEIFGEEWMWDSSMVEKALRVKKRFHNVKDFAERVKKEEEDLNPKMLPKAVAVYYEAYIRECKK